MPFLFKLARRVARIRARACILAVAAAIACDAPDHLVSPSHPTFITSSAATTCQASAVSWWTGALSSAQTGTFTATFDVTPNGSGLDAVTGLATGSVTGYTGMAMIVRFNSANTIDARNGGSYAAATSVPYTAGTAYHLRLVANVPTHT